MTFIAKVHNGTIVVPPDLELPEGAEVEIHTRTAPADLASPKPENAKNAGVEGADGNPIENPFEWMREFIGAIDDGPEDMAAEHDHYLYGTPKRKGR